MMHDSIHGDRLLKGRSLDRSHRVFVKSLVPIRSLSSDVRYEAALTDASSGPSVFGESVSGFRTCTIHFTHLSSGFVAVGE
jgi:hypothetical protein